MSQNSRNHLVRANSDSLVIQVISEWKDKFLAEVKEHFEAEGLEECYEALYPESERQ
jgi:quinol monooxygenase YgiN